MCRDKSLKKLSEYISKHGWNSRRILKLALSSGYTLFIEIQKLHFISFSKCLLISKLATSKSILP